MPHAHPRGFPPRSQHGEGQALALRYSVRFQYGEGQALALRPTEIHKVTVARGPSEVSIRASERVSPAIVSVTVARGPRRFPYAHPSGFPPRSQHGEGQALALRYSVRFQHGEGQALALRPTEIHKVTVARGPSDATRASERVSPAIASVTVARGPVPRDRCQRRILTNAA